MNMSRSFAIAVIIAATSTHSLAQKDDYALAYEKYDAGDIAAARMLIDRAATQPELAADPGLWLLRGFIYKELFKGATSAAEADSLRDMAISSLATSLSRDTAGAFTKDARQASDYLTKTFYNDAAKALNEGNADRATQLYAKYKETTARLEPDHDFRARDIEFGNALGTVFTKHYNQDRLDTTWFDKAIRAYKAVIAMDPENYGANYNLATLYYNRGVYNIQRITPENDIPGIQDIQRVSRELFTEALPFMLKAHQMNPTRKETLLGLEGIYYSLQNNEESEKYRKMYEALQPEEER